MDKVKKIINTVLNISIVFLAIMLFFSIFLDFQTSFLKKSYKSFFGISAFEIKTASMEGSINIGDLVFVKNTSNVNLNDVITYQVGDSFITHRVVQQYGDTYVTKGDANNTDDDPITSKQVVGKVIFVLPKLGIVKSIVFKAEFLVPLIIVLFVICLIIDDKEDRKSSYLSFFKNRFKREKKSKDTDVVEQVIKEADTADVDLSKTAVLSKVNVKSNKKLLDTINKSNKTNVKDEDYYEEPVIVKNI